RTRHGRRVPPGRPHQRAARGSRAGGGYARADAWRSHRERGLSRQGRGVSALLEVRDLHAYYGESHVLQGVSLTVGEGECVAVLGRNGVGKTTTLSAIVGLVR